MHHCCSNYAVKAVCMFFQDLSSYYYVDQAMQSFTHGDIVFTECHSGMVTKLCML